MAITTSPNELTIEDILARDLPSLRLPIATSTSQSRRSDTGIITPRDTKFAIPMYSLEALMIKLLQYSAERNHPFVDGNVVVLDDTGLTYAVLAQDHLPGFVEDPLVKLRSRLAGNNNPNKFVFVSGTRDAEDVRGDILRFYDKLPKSVDMGGYKPKTKMVKPSDLEILHGTLPELADINTGTLPKLGKTSILILNRVLEKYDEQTRVQILRAAVNLIAPGGYIAISVGDDLIASSWPDAYRAGLQKVGSQSVSNVNGYRAGIVDRNWQLTQFVNIRSIIDVLDDASSSSSSRIRTKITTENETRSYDSRLDFVRYIAHVALPVYVSSIGVSNGIITPKQYEAFLHMARAYCDMESCRVEYPATTHYVLVRKLLPRDTPSESRGFTADKDAEKYKPNRGNGASGIGHNLPRARHDSDRNRGLRLAG